MKIIKIGGSVLFERHQPVARALARQSGKLLVIVGYGPRLRLLVGMHGIPERRLEKMSGGTVRVTDDLTAAASYFASSIELNALINALRMLNVKCTGLYGSQGLLCGERHARVRYRDGGVLRTYDRDQSGRITTIVGELIESELGNVECLVISPVLRDARSGQLLVCDADYAAVEIACSLKAELLTIVTDVPGYMVDSKVVHAVSAHQIDRCMETASGGMRKKLGFIKMGLKNGLRKVVVGNTDLLLGDTDNCGTTFG